MYFGNKRNSEKYGYMYIFNFDRKIRFKNYDFEIINKCQIFIATTNQFSSLTKMTKSGCNFIKYL